MTSPEFDEADVLDQRVPIGSTLEGAGAAALPDDEAMYAPVPAGLRDTEPDRGRFD